MQEKVNPALTRKCTSQNKDRKLELLKALVKCLEKNCFPHALSNDCACTTYTHFIQLHLVQTGIQL